MGIWGHLDDLETRDGERHGEGYKREVVVCRDGCASRCASEGLLGWRPNLKEQRSMVLDELDYSHNRSPSLEAKGLRICSRRLQVLGRSATLTVIIVFIANPSAAVRDHRDGMLRKLT